MHLLSVMRPRKINLFRTESVDEWAKPRLLWLQCMGRVYTGALPSPEDDLYRKQQENEQYEHLMSAMQGSHPGVFPS